MCQTICGADCSGCPSKDICGGCIKTKGRPFKKECLVAACCLNKGQEKCSECRDSVCGIKYDAIIEFNALGIKDMPQVTELNELRGNFINLEYTLENGEKIKLLDDDKIYLANQICKEGSERCYGLAADKDYLLVCEYGEMGTNPEIIIYKKRAR